MNNDNLRALSRDEAVKNGRKGGIASGKARRERKALKEQLLLLLDDEDTQKELCTALLNQAIGGNTKAFEIIRDTIGEKPIDKHELTGETLKQALVVFDEPESKDNDKQADDV
ncbi:MAG: hypothetical protein IKN71_04150 [Alphaproteobacteria bacterium]|nr:hypothetical protein [Alphaproteobacteria bacterium]